jgi:prevent-host-death family protein
VQNVDALAGYLDISEKSLASRDAKAHFSEVLAGLDEGPVMVSVYNKPRAVIVEVKRFLELLQQSEALNIMLALKQAEAEPANTYDEVEAIIMRDRAARQTERESQPG